MKRLIGAIVCGGIAVFAGATAMEDNTTRGADGEITESGGLGVFAMQVGDCVQLSDEELIASVEGVPCDSAHDAQVYAELDLPGDRFPGDLDLQERSFEGCVARWQPAVATDWEADTVYDVEALRPTASSWKAGDREVLCLIVRIDGERITKDLLRATGDGQG